MVPLSKKKDKDKAELKHIATPHLLQTRIYQAGFKEDTSIDTHISSLLATDTLIAG